MEASQAGTGEMLQEWGFPRFFLWPLGRMWLPGEHERKGGKGATGLATRVGWSRRLWGRMGEERNCLRFVPRLVFLFPWSSAKGKIP